MTVVIGVDPAKRSNTVEVIDDREEVLATLQVVHSSEGYQELRAFAAQWPQRRWAVEGAGSVGLHLAQRLLSDGELVLDVPPKLSARVRVLDSGLGRKTDATDAHAIAVAGLRSKKLREVRPDDHLVSLRLLADRRNDLVQSRTQAVNRIHKLLAELLPGGGKSKLKAHQAAALLEGLAVTDVAGMTRRQIALDLVEDVRVLDARIKEVEKLIKTAVIESGTSLTQVCGIGYILAAQIIGEVGDIRRFASRDHFASYSGIAPVDDSSGDTDRKRMSRRGNRHLNYCVHIVALVHRQHDPLGKAYYDKKIADGKGEIRAMRAMKRRVSDVVYKALMADVRALNPATDGH